MRKFFAYFFGAGETAEFKYFSLAHILPILLLGLAIFLIVKFAKKFKECKHEERIRLALAFILIITEMSYFWRLVGIESLEANPVDHLPITVCGWAIIFCSFLVVTKSQSLFDIAYFWVFAGSTMGILTPTVITFTGPTRFRYYQFWLEHTLGFIVLFYMMFVHKMRPNWKSIIKSFAVLMILGVVAIVANTILPGANYLFMAMPEDEASILDILPKNLVVRIIVMAILIGILFFLAYLPWLILDIRAKKKALATANAENNTTTLPVENIKVETSKNTKTNKSKQNTVVESPKSTKKSTKKDTSEETKVEKPKKSDTKSTTKKEVVENVEKPKTAKSTTNKTTKSTKSTTTKVTPKTTEKVEVKEPTKAEPKKTTTKTTTKSSAKTSTKTTTTKATSTKKSK